MKPISVLWSDGVSELEARTAIHALRDFLRHLQSVALEQDIGLSPITIRPFGNWELKDVERDEPYQSFRWYWESSLDDDRGRVSAQTFFDIIRYEPWQQVEPHFDLAVLHVDIHDDAAPANLPDRNVSAFSCTEPGLVTVVSTHHLAQIADADLRLRCLRRLVMHNFGHVIGLAANVRADAGTCEEEVDCAEPILTGCAPTCIMYEVHSLEELLELCAEGYTEPEMCAMCNTALRTIVFLLHFSTN